MLHYLQWLRDAHPWILAQFRNIACRPNKMMAFGKSHDCAPKRRLAAESHESLILKIQGDEIVTRNPSQRGSEAREFLCPKARTLMHYDTSWSLPFVKVGVSRDRSSEQALGTHCIQVRAFVSLPRNRCRLAFQHDTFTIAREHLSETGLKVGVLMRPFLVERNAYETGVLRQLLKPPRNVVRLVKESGEKVPCSRRRILGEGFTAQHALPGKLRCESMAHRVRLDCMVDVPKPVIRRAHLLAEVERKHLLSLCGLLAFQAADNFLHRTQHNPSGPMLIAD